MSVELKVSVSSPLTFIFLDVLSQSPSDVGEDIVPANIISKVLVQGTAFPTSTHSMVS